MPEAEAQRARRDPRGSKALRDRLGLKGYEVCRDRWDHKAPKAIRALRDLQVHREREDRLDPPRWI